MMTHIDMVAFCKALGDETRQRILEILQNEGEKCVSDLVDVFNVSQPTISHHLNFLKQANLVTSRREGKQIYYRANQDNITECCGILFTKLVPSELDLSEFVELEQEAA
ncbi:MAG: metalloregulator ArsR/SmtB family transcription factor [Anaerolineae bacterium]|nr:metalloregulator ArsR/SmtB family transcription factor [Anaerolineae bacterium]